MLAGLFDDNEGMTALAQFNLKKAMTPIVCGLAFTWSADPSIAQQSASGSPPASATAPAPHPLQHPTLENVVGALQFAKIVLGQPKPRSRSHRYQALKYVEKAISEVKAAIKAGEK